MKAITSFILFLLLLCSCTAQIMGVRDRKVFTSSGGAHTWTLDPSVTPCNNPDLSDSSLTNSCTLTGVTAGDLITVQEGDRNCLFTTVSDNVNSGNYSSVYINQADSGDANCTGQLYRFNSAAGTVTVTAHFSTTQFWDHIAAQAWKDSGGGAAGSLDATFSSSASPFFQASTTGTVPNANCGTAKTPSNNNELVIAYVESDSIQPTVGANYTLLMSTEVGNPAAVQYWIQSTATSTNGTFVNGVDDWGAGCAAFKP